MITANMHEAKSQLSKLVRAAERGEDVFICRRGHPLVKLVVQQPQRPRRLLRQRPDLRVALASGYDPAEPLSEEEWPSDCR